MSEQTRLALNAICKKSFEPFAIRAFPDVFGKGLKLEWNWHVECIAEHLQAAFEGDIRRLIINVPPRTLKSYLVSSAFPAWVLGLNPSANFIVTSHAYSLAEDQVVNCRNILQSDWYQQCYPATQVDPTQNQKHDFKTLARGRVYGAGILGTIMGKGADYVIIDDPVKPDEALSDTIRTNTNTAIRNTLFSRLNDPRTGSVIMIMQRLHEDDPTGNLLQDGGYTHVKLPAQAVGAPVMISLKGKNWQMKQNELLFPQRLTADSLEEKRRDLQEYNYVGQYLQEPVPLGGGEFKDTWLNYYGNGETKPKEMNIYITCDPAGGEELQKKKKKLSDFTCFMVIGLHTDNNYYLLDAVRDRLNPTERVDKLFELHKTWSSLSGKPPKVGYEKYGLMTDTHYIREKQKQIGYRFQLIELGGSMSKEERVRRIIPDLQHGRWWFPSGLLYTDYEGKTLDLMRELVKSEMASFPKARYDDMLDALTRIYDDELQAIFPFVKKPKARTKSQSYGHFLDF